MDLLTTRDVSAQTGFSLPKVRALIEAGKLPAKNTSTGAKRPRWVIRREDLDAYFTPDTVRQAPSAPRRRRIDADVAQKL